MPALPPGGAGIRTHDAQAPCVRRKPEGSSGRIRQESARFVASHPRAAALFLQGRRNGGKEEPAMGKRILVISTSPRKNGNSALLAEEFARGAADAGHRTELVSLHDRNIAFCRGCLSCVRTHRCVMQDDAADIVARMKVADVIAFATPVYYFAMSGQMKTLLDRSNPLYASDYAFRDIYLLACAAENDAAAVDGVVNGLEGWIRFFDKCALKGVVRGVGVTDPGDIRRHADILNEACRLGKQA